MTHFTIIDGLLVQIVFALYAVFKTMLQIDTRASNILKWILLDFYDTFSNNDILL